MHLMGISTPNMLCSVVPNSKSFATISGKMVVGIFKTLTAQIPHCFTKGSYSPVADAFVMSVTCCFPAVNLYTNHVSIVPKSALFACTSFFKSEILVNAQANFIVD